MARLGVSILLLLLSLPLLAQEWVRHPGMQLPGRITRDANGVAHIQAFTDTDAAFLNGWIHANDRLFQMDENRRTASGTLAELLGTPALPTDVQLRTIGLRRAASLSQLEYSPQVTAVLQAYANGVNAWVSSNPLPPEYAALEVTQFEPWTALDSIAVAKLLAFGLSFESDIDNTIAFLTYQAAGQQLGVNGAVLFAEDLFRSEPFDHASTVPDATATGNAVVQSEGSGTVTPLSLDVRPETLELLEEYDAQLEAIPFFQRLLDTDNRAGSNEWAIAGRHTTTGNPMIANDPHLALRMPSTFYPIGISGSRIHAVGVGFPGVPLVVQGHTPRIAWGSTVNPMDVTDWYQEQVVPDSTSPSGLSSMFNGQREHLLPIPQVFRANVTNDGTPNSLVVVPSSATVPQASLIVSRRNAPIVSLNLQTGAGVSVQYIGLGPTRELETFLIWNSARNLDDFRNGLNYFDVGSQNWVYTDVEGNIAYFTSGEMPLREDLQSGTVTGAPPFLLRDGTRPGNEWLRAPTRTATQASPYQLLPQSEMPQLVNPPSGWFVNANNDPAGTTLDNNPLNQLRPGGGIFYLNAAYSGFRAGRITQLIREQLARGEKFSMDDMQRIQADVVMLDAQYFVPWILRASQNSEAVARFPQPVAGIVAAAVSRLSNWDFSTPTGIPEGYDAADVNGQLSPPSQTEINRSVAATIYSVWRSMFIKNTIDAVLGAGNLPRPPAQQTVVALKNLLENFETRRGAGASGVQFFNVPGTPATAENAAFRRDVLILASLADAVALLSSEAFAPAFNRSTNLDDYRWGKLHRVVFRHPLGGPFNTPPAGGAFPPPLAGLDGIPVDGGFEVVDASSHNPRANTLNGFMFSSGPNRRSVSEGVPDGIRAVTSLPGGVSGVLGNPLYINLLRPWLTNEAFPIELQRRVILPWGVR